MIRKSLLWSSLALSTALSAGFFYSLGDGVVSGLFLAAVGIIFEGLKAFSWKRTGMGHKAYLWLAVPCTILSLAASIGYASLTLERGWSEADTRHITSSQQDANAASLDREEKVLIEGIAKLPPGWTTSTLRMSERLDAIRRSRSNLESHQLGTMAETRTAALAVSLGRRFGLDGSWVVSILMMAIATLLEVGIVVLVLDRDNTKHLPAVRNPESQADQFLREALGPDGRLLGRRRLVELGWTEKEVRDHVTTLLQSGVLTHQGRGSPIRVASGYSSE